MLPRVIGQGRAAELLYPGRAMAAEESEPWGFFDPLSTTEVLETDAIRRPRGTSAGPGFAHAMTKTMLEPGVVDVGSPGDRGGSASAVDLHADRDFRRAYDAFVAKAPRFDGDHCRPAGQELLSWPFSRPAHATTRERLEAWARRSTASTHGDVHAACRGWSRPRTDGWLKRTASLLDDGEAGSMCDAALITKNPGPARRPRRFRPRHARAGRRRDHPIRQRRAARGGSDGPVPAPLSRPSRCPSRVPALMSPISHMAAPRRRWLCARRREDLDLQWRHR